jgi:hypothetical protein
MRRHQGLESLDLGHVSAQERLERNPRRRARNHELASAKRVRFVRGARELNQSPDQENIKFAASVPIVLILPCSCLLKR